ncbi:twin-arginine translocation signal domain-containing protein [Microvirga vignae]|nr:twin-arginine translocation signal domain-containing protein [Microvirga vignae]
MPEKRNRVTLIDLDGPVFSRRAFLRGTVLGAAAAGTGTLSACMPMMPPQAAAPAPAGPPMVARGLPRNVPKAVARYQDRPNRGQRCGRCMHFIEPGGCEIVTGRISPQGWCRYFEAMA